MQLLLFVGSNTGVINLLLRSAIATVRINDELKPYEFPVRINNNS